MVLVTEAFIYILEDPQSNTIHYVGKTIQPKTRLNGHIGSAKYQRTLVEKWIYSLALKGQVPTMRIVEECSEDVINEKEKYWIDFLSESNTLLNSKNHIGSGKVREVTLSQQPPIESIDFRLDKWPNSFNQLFKEYNAKPYRVADEIKMPRNTVYRMLNEAGIPKSARIETLERIARYFGYRIEINFIKDSND